MRNDLEKGGGKRKHNGVEPKTKKGREKKKTFTSPTWQKGSLSARVVKLIDRGKRKRRWMHAFTGGKGKKKGGEGLVGGGKTLRAIIRERTLRQRKGKGVSSSRFIMSEGKKGRGGGGVIDLVGGKGGRREEGRLLWEEENQ